MDAQIDSVVGDLVGSRVFLGMAAAPRAHAFHLTAEGAGAFTTQNYGFVSSPNPMIAASLTFGLGDLLQVGVIYDHNYLSYASGGTGTLNFYGGTVHMGLFDPIFVDAQAGIDQRDSSGNSFSWGLGTGLAFPLTPFLEFGPRVGYRFVPDSNVERTMLDVGAYLTLTFL